MSQLIAHIEILIHSKYSIKNVRGEAEKSIAQWLQDQPKLLEHFMTKAEQNNNNCNIKDLPASVGNKIKKVNLNYNGDKKGTTVIVNTDNVEQQSSMVETKQYGQVCLVFYFYKEYTDRVQNNIEEELPSTFHTMLPSTSYVGLWDSLIFETNIRDKLLKYVTTSLLFAKHGVDSAIISWNKVVLLHGPPGTGKTTLCKALAQKLAIRLHHCYEHFQLIEINSHSLFSKWFSESGKLVLKLFDGIREVAEDGSHLIFVLIDEVESLAYDRQRSNSDPSDAVRVVNALLTQIDSIRRYPNVVILANSNVVDAMDNAFIDRVDIKQYIGLPPESCVYKIFQSCINELETSKILEKDSDQQILSYKEVTSNNDWLDTEAKKCSDMLLDIVRKGKTLSGRTLRKLPFLAIALYGDQNIPVSLNDYLELLSISVDKQLEDNQYFSNGN